MTDNETRLKDSEAELKARLKKRGQRRPITWEEEEDKKKRKGARVVAINDTRKAAIAQGLGTPKSEQKDLFGGTV